MSYELEHEPGRFYSCKDLVEYLNLMPSSQYVAITKFYETLGPRGGKKWWQYLQLIDKELEEGNYVPGSSIQLSTLKDALERWLRAAAVKGGNGNVKMPENMCAAHEKLQRRDAEDAAIALGRMRELARDRAG